jgi:hypothetical protein
MSVPMHMGLGWKNGGRDHERNGETATVTLEYIFATDVSTLNKLQFGGFFDGIISSAAL